MRDILIIFVLCVVAIGVGSWLYFGLTDEPQDVALSETTQAMPEAEDVAFTTLASGDHSGMLERRNYVYADEEEFAKVWKQIHPDDSMPDVDFTTESVIAVFMGEKPSGGSAVKVEKVTDQGDTETVSIVLTQPGPGCVVTQALTSPFTMVKVPTSGLTPKAEERTDVIDCP